MSNLPLPPQPQPKRARRMPLPGAFIALLALGVTVTVFGIPTLATGGGPTLLLVGIGSLSALLPLLAIIQAIYHAAEHLSR